jgi:Smg protein
MFDILLYLYDNYLVMETIPDPNVLSRKLTAAGFEADEIDQALSWLSALDQLSPEAPCFESTGMRCYAEAEWRRVEAEGLAFLTFLENAGLLSPQGREWVLDRALALKDSEISTDKIKWIALLAISRLRGPGDALWLEDLVRGGEDGHVPTLH